MTGVEYADRGRASEFPAEWGVPPVDPRELERWVRRNVEIRELPKQHVRRLLELHLRREH